MRRVGRGPEDVVASAGAPGRARLGFRSVAGACQAAAGGVPPWRFRPAWPDRLLIARGPVSGASALVARVVTPFRVLLAHRKVISSFVHRDLRARYINSVLGLSWAVIQPLSLLVLYTFVFSVILGVRLGGDGSTGSFALYLFCGMLPWLAFAEGISRSASSILDHAILIRKVVFPSETLPAYVVVSALVTEFVGLVILLLATTIFARPPGPTLFLLPLLVVLQAMLTLGLGWFLASVNVFLRDVGQVLGLGLTLWMLVTPIFYPPEMVPSRFRFFLHVNPMHYLVQAYRDIVLEHRLPGGSDLAVVAVVALGAFLGGHWFFCRSKNAFVDVI